MNETYSETLFNFLYHNVSGYNISHSARRHHSDQNVVPDLLYGEVPFPVLRDILHIAKPKQDGVFFDLGSGTGRVVIAAHLLCNFRQSIGVELLKGLYDQSCKVKEQFESIIQPKIASHCHGREIQFFNQNIFDIDLHDADMIFMNHPFKDRELFALLEEKFLTELKPGTKIVATIRSLTSQSFTSLGSKKYQFSWGESTAYFYEI